MPSPFDEIDAMQATLLRALASPHRLRIVHLLGERPREVHEIAHDLGLGQATASQHLAAMRSVGLVEASRDGRTVRYGLSDPQILAACRLMREVIVRRLSALGSLAAAASRGLDGERAIRRPDAATAASLDASTPHPQLVTPR